MRVFSVLLAVASALLASSNAAMASTTTELSRMVSSDEAQVAGITNRYLRSHEADEEEGDSAEEEDSEERVLVNTAKIDDLLDLTQLDDALYSKPIRVQLFEKWNAAPAGVRIEAVQQLATKFKYEKYKRIVSGWNTYKGRTDAGIALHVPYLTVERLLNPTLMDKALKGERGRKDLFKKWRAASATERTEALTMLSNDKDLSAKYKNILRIWDYQNQAKITKVCYR